MRRCVLVGVVSAVWSSWGSKKRAKRRLKTSAGVSSHYLPFFSSFSSWFSCFRFLGRSASYDAFLFFLNGCMYSPQVLFPIFPSTISRLLQISPYSHVSLESVFLSLSFSCFLVLASCRTSASHSSGSWPSPAARIMPATTRQLIEWSF